MDKFSSIPQPNLLNCAELCETCRTIDFAAAIKAAQSSLHPSKSFFTPYVTQINVCPLGHVVAGTDCPLCGFFLGMKPIGGSSHRLHCISARKFEFLDQSQDWSPELGAVLFYVKESQSSVISGPTFEVVEKSNTNPQSRRLVLDSSGPIDWNQIKSWLLHCNNAHGTGNLTQHHDKACQGVDFCPNLKVLDCETRRIVDLPSDSTPYVALSYLWGQSPGNDLINNEHLHAGPRTIEDAIHTVLNLNYRYLWVDRYCVNQDDTTEKHRLICNMGRIYRCSALTLIAAVGEGPEYGLPGITPGLRKARKSLHIGPWELTAQNTYLNEYMWGTKWNSRGWTYQEGLLSRRRLVFTDSQIFFQCRYNYCLESIPAPINLLKLSKYTQRKPRFDLSTGAYPPSHVFPSEDENSDAMSILQLISEFSHRDFSYPSDVLDAFAGILHMFLQRHKHVDHIYGLPLFDPNQMKGLRANEYPSRRTNAFACALMWQTTAHATRRSVFPSWTWAGWKVEKHQDGSRALAYMINRPSLAHVALESSVEVAIQFGEGEILPWESHQPHITKLSQELSISPVLLVTAWLFGFDRLEQGVPDGQQFNYDYEPFLWALSGKHQIYVRGPPLPLDINALEPGSFAAAIMVEAKMNSSRWKEARTCISGLLLLKKTYIDGKICYERFGVGTSCSDNSTARKPLDKREVIDLMGATRQLFRLV